MVRIKELKNEDGRNFYTNFYYKLHHFGGRVEAYKMFVDVNTFLDLWNDSKGRCYKIEPITRDQYYENIVNRNVLTYPVSKLNKNVLDKSCVYECYDIQSPCYSIR